MQEYKKIKLKSTQHLRSIWNLAVNSTKTVPSLSQKVVKVRVNICNKLIVCEILVSARCISKSSSKFLGRNLFSVLFCCISYTPQSTHRNLEEPTANLCYIHVRRGGRVLRTGAIVIENQTAINKTN